MESIPISSALLPAKESGVMTSASSLMSIAFLGIGLESDFRSLSSQITGGKTLNLYIVSQLFNIILTFIFAWLLFS